jgi:alpha-amylase/alpha-mannosidase (GH57 family)
VARYPPHRSARADAQLLLAIALMPQTYLCFVWHMHQPVYKDLATGEYRLPWTRLHALKDYYGMVKLLGEFPTVHQTFNLVPTMVEQIQEYASGAAADPFLRRALAPAESLSQSERDWMLRYFFQASDRVLHRHPRYGELFNAWQASGRNPAQARTLFGDQEIRDLQVLSQLAWFDEEFLAHDPEVRALVEKGRDYSLEDQALMGRKQLEILGRVVPAWQEVAASGQIEISTTPFYHPILPLICDSDVASISHPGVTLPTRFRYPQDARWQLTTARNFIEREFGHAPAGLWPSEGSVSDEVLGLAAESGFAWIASDSGVLARTLHKTATPDLTYGSYLWWQGERSIRVLFRDHLLSDLIGFTYSRMDASEAAEHFLQQIRDNCQPMLDQGRDVLVPIILDGENAWEHYHENGRPFLRELYGRIAAEPAMIALTVSEALSRLESQRLDNIFPGSWINANFDVWIGAEEDNRAWEFLLRARQTYSEHADGVPEDRRKLAYEELLIAEGSDWCWWYGPEHQSDNRGDFDQLYRGHLAGVYKALGQPVPPELDRPILIACNIEVHQHPTSFIHPVIDGDVTSDLEWIGAGHYRVDNRSGSMHSAASLIEDLYYGTDGTNLYLRIDPATGADFTAIDLRTADRSLPLQYAFHGAVEARVSLSSLEPGDTLRFQLVFTRNGLPVETVPQYGWIEFSTS